jgi:glycolate oxidase FAD binding subunit
MTAAGATLAEFAADVGPVASGPVACVGGRTQWAVGGAAAAAAREVTAPRGVVAHEPGEMIVRVRAGTPLAELAAATMIGGQFVALEADDPDAATVGGVLACGRSGVRRLGRGPIRDAVLEVKMVTAAGEMVRAGAPLVKNVTGYDLCRLLVGSIGTLGFLAEVVLRCHPRPEAEEWWRSEPGAGVDPFRILAALYRPLALLWDGASVWVGLSGRRVDVRDQARSVLGGFAPVEAPPPRPGPYRRSRPAAGLSALPATVGATGWLAEVGVGLVHCDAAAARALSTPPASTGVVDLHHRIKERFDPTGRLNPGRSPLRAQVGAPT